MKSEYEPKTLDQKMGYLVEECGEVLAAAGKSLRWGLDSCNPELPEAERTAAVRALVSRVVRERDARRGGECICRRCGLRTDADPVAADV